MIKILILKCRVSSLARSIITCKYTFCKSIFLLLLILKMIIIYQIKAYNLYPGILSESPTSKALLGFKSWTQSYRTVQVERSNHYAIETKYLKR